jgi:Putative auto-transporter adhesin, head GIN domain
MRTRSLFGPLILIAIGILWLLAVTDAIPLGNLWALAHLVPFALIAFGISLLVRAVWAPGGALLSFLVVAGIILAVVFASQLGWNDPPSWAMNWDIGENTGGGIRGSGVIASETRKVSGINSIEVDYPSAVFIQQGDAESVTVEAEDNLLPQLSTEVVNGRMVIRNTEGDWSDRVNPTEDVEINITVVDVSQVQFSSAGELRVDGLQLDDLEIAISGICDATLTDLDVDRLDYLLSGLGSSDAEGVARTLNLRLSGAGDFDGENLSVQSADVRISGAGSATVWVQNELDVEISGAGTLNYFGDPVVTQQISGAGTVNDKGDK